MRPDAEPRCTALAVATKTARARFCAGCGADLMRRCPSCGAEAPEASRFCDACGKPLTAAATAPAPIAPATDTSERRQLTVLFCDLLGSTELAARLDPEDWQDVLRTYQSRAGEVIARHGGHVASPTGRGNAPKKS